MGIIASMTAVVASGFSWHHVVIVCAVFAGIGVIALLVGRLRSRRNPEPPADDGNPIINALLSLFNFWP